ncbi:MAG: hypothetical protein LH615_14945 [Ferruginibacter sp.]|nr:hypothetical protein [Ferruginibacter sp.]
MNSAFETLNDLLYQNETVVSAAEKTKQQKKIKEQVDNLPFEFSKAYFSEASKKMLTGTVQYSQAATSFLLNRVYEYNEAAPNEFYKFLQVSLCFFIRVLYKNFPAHFDYSLPMPEVLWQPVKQEAEAGWVALLEQGMEERLNKIILNELQLCCEHRAPDYKVGYYWKDLTQHQKQCNGNDGALTNQVIEVLVSCNFNSGKFILYVIEWCAGGIKDDMPEVNYWCTVLKLVNRMPITPNMCLHPVFEPCKQQLIQSITTELFASEKMLPEQINEAKLITAMSVGQLAVFIRLMVDTEVLQTKNVMAIIKFFSKNFRTYRTVQISDESLRQRYYNIDKASIDINRRYLAGMMNKLKEY